MKDFVNHQCTLEAGMLKKTSFRIYACNFFILFFLASSMSSVLLVYKLAVPDAENQIWTALVTGISSNNSNMMATTNDIMEIFRQLQHRILLIFIGCLLACVLVSLFIIHTIMNRLDDMRKVAAKMAEGHLDKTISLHRCDEIGAVGKAINDLAANFQEILLLLWNQTQNCLRHLNYENEVDGTGSEITFGLDDKIHHMRKDLEDMQTMIRSFNFYGVGLEEGKLSNMQDQQEKLPRPTGDSK